MRVPPDVSGYRTRTPRVQRDGTPGSVWRHALRSSLALTTLACIVGGAYGAVADACAGDAPGTDDTLARVRATGELRWGADAQGGAPYVFQDPMDPNHLIGFEVDFVDALAQKLALRARPVQGQWDELLDLLKRGDFDVAVNGIEVADEKKRVCLLSRPYYAAAEKLTVRKNDASAPKSLEALRGRKVGTLPGSLAERI